MNTAGHLQVGMVLDGRFEIERHVADGGMGSIFRARDRRTLKWVAIKVLHHLSPQDRVRFFREGRLLSELRHPRIVSYIAIGSLDSEPYLVLEWLEGHDLKTHLEQHGHLPVSTSLRVLRGLAEALRVTHARGILHRDLKPTNVFLRGGSPDAVLLIDFGIAAGPGGFRITRTGMIVGTPEYMAPEQTLRAPRLGPETDIYAAGCVLFECLSGRPPFIADHVAAVLARVLFDEPPPLASIRPDTPPALEALLLRMLNKDPVQRPADATALLAELQTRESELALQTASTTLQQPTLSVLSSRADSDQILVNVVLAAPRQQPVEAQPGGQTLTLRQSESGGPPRAPHPTLRAALTDLGVGPNDSDAASAKRARRLLAFSVSADILTLRRDFGVASE